MAKLTDGEDLKTVNAKKEGKNRSSRHFDQTCFNCMGCFMILMENPKFSEPETLPIDLNVKEVLSYRRPIGHKAAKAVKKTEKNREETAAILKILEDLRKDMAKENGIFSKLVEDIEADRELSRRKREENLSLKANERRRR